MDNKLYNNIIYDAFVVLLDFVILLGSYMFCREIFAFSDIISWTPFVCIAIILFFMYDMYSKTIRSRYELFLIIVISIFLDCTVCTLASVITLGERFSEIIIFYVLLAVMSMSMLVVAKLIQLRFVKAIEGNPSLLVLESVKNGNSLAKKIKYSYSVLYEAYYEIVDDENEAEIRNLIDNRMRDFDSIFISSSISQKVKYRIIERAFETGKPVYVLPDVVSISILKSKMVQFDDTPALRLESLRFSHSQRVIKRAIDIVFSVFFGIFALPIIAVCAIAVKLDSKGTVFYRQKRLTRDKKPFTMYKIRTMIKAEDAEKQKRNLGVPDSNGYVFTRVGAKLSKWKIDELPQLVNVFLGQMSFVGPRPENPQTAEIYSQTVENYDKRFYVKAGLTGLSQVYGKNRTKSEDRTMYDIMYIREYSLLLDVKILLLTVKVLFMTDETNEPDESLVRNESTNLTLKSALEYTQDKKKADGKKYDER